MRRPGARFALSTLVATAACALAPVVLPATPASASTYAYWSYWHNKGGGFTYSGCGPYYPQGDCVPADGTIEGWRFTISSEGGAKAPRFSGTFDQVCGSVAPVEGKKRVAFAVDFGTQPGAPAQVLARCALGNPNDNGGVMLQNAYAVETGKDSFVCKIESYPKSGCGDFVADPTPTPTKTSAAGGATSTPTSRATSTPASGGSTSGSTTTPTPVVSNGVTITPTPTPITSGSAVPFAPSPGAAVTDPDSSTAPDVVFGGEKKTSGGGSPIGTIVGIAVIAVGGAAGLITARRRRST